MINLKNYESFIWMGFKCLKAAEPQLGYSLLFSTKTFGVPGTHMIDLRKMKDLNDRGATQ